MRKDTYKMNYGKNITDEWRKAKRSGQLHDLTAIYSPMRVNEAVIREIGEDYPTIKTIYMPSSLIKQLGVKPWKAASEHRIRIKISKLTVGRPRKHKAPAIYQVLRMRRGGISASDISRQTGIPLRTVYFILKHR